MSADSTSKGFADLTEVKGVLPVAGVQVRRLEHVVDDLLEHVVFGRLLQIDQETKILLQGNPPTLAVRYGTERQFVLVTLGAVFEDRAEVEQLFNAKAQVLNELTPMTAWLRGSLARDAARVRTLVAALERYEIIGVDTVELVSVPQGSSSENNEP